MFKSVSAVIDFFKAIQRDRIIAHINTHLEAENTCEAFHALNTLTHDHATDPQIPAFVLSALDKLSELTTPEDASGATASHAASIALIDAPKNSEYEEKLLEYVNKDYDMSVGQAYTPALLENHLYDLTSVGDKSPLRKVLLQKIIDAANTPPRLSSQELIKLDHYEIFTPERILNILFTAACIAGPQTIEGQSALRKWNHHLDIMTSDSPHRALALACATKVFYTKDDTAQKKILDQTIGDKVTVLFNDALQGESLNEALGYAPRVANLSGDRTGTWQTLHDLSSTLEKVDLASCVKAAGQAALLTKETEQEYTDVAHWSSLYDILATQDTGQALQAIKDVGSQNHGKISTTARSKLFSLADAAFTRGNMIEALGIAKDAANFEQGTDKWHALIIEISKSDIQQALDITFSASETYSGNGKELSSLAAQTYVELAAELAHISPAEGLRHLHTIAHDSAGTRDMFGTKHKESPMGPPATEKWIEIVTELSKTDPGQAFIAAKAAVKYWEDKAPRDEGRIPGSMYRAAKRFTRDLEHSQPAPSFNM